MQRLRRPMRRVREVRVRRSQITSEFVERVMADENTGRCVQNAVIGVESLDRHSTAGRVTLAEDLLKVAMKQFANAVIHNIPPQVSSVGLWRNASRGFDQDE